MPIEERDLFYYIWNPKALDPAKSSYLKSNLDEYRWILEILIFVYESEKMNTNLDIIIENARMINTND